MLTVIYLLDVVLPIVEVLHMLAVVDLLDVVLSIV
jgi:hypothetical protein